MVNRWLRGPRGDVTADVVAGLNLAIVLVPMALAYAALAGMPPITGLYAALACLLVYAALGSSRHLDVGPAAIISLLTASALGPLAAGDASRFVALAGLLAVMVGGLMLLMWLLRLGLIASFLSHAVIVGFTSAAAVVIALTQAGALVGVDQPARDWPLLLVGDLPAVLRAASPFAAALGVGSLVLLLALRKLAPRAPGFLVVTVGGALVVWLLDALDVPLIGAVPAGLPLPALPALDLDAARALVPAALAITLVAFAEGVGIGKAVATRTRTRIDADRELLAQGSANVAAGLLGGFPCAASFSRTALRYEAGARSQLTGVVAAAVVALALTLLTPVFAYLPHAVLAAIIIVSVASLINVRGGLELARTGRVDAAALTLTFGGTLLFGVERGLLGGVVFTLLVYLYQQARPPVVELGRVVGTGKYRNRQRYPVRVDEHVAILRIDAPLLFMSAEALADSVNRLAAERPHLRLLVLVTSVMPRIDATGVHVLEVIADDLDRAGIDLRLATVRGPVRSTLQRTGLWDRLRDRCHPDIPTALAAAGVPATSPLRAVDPREEAPPTVL